MNFNMNIVGWRRTKARCQLIEDFLLKKDRESESKNIVLESVGGENQKVAKKRDRETERESLS